MRSGKRKPTSAALKGGALTALAVYVAVAPFQCDAARSCDGLVAFHYPPTSAGHWQALGAAAVVGAGVALLLWTSFEREGRVSAVSRVVVTVLLALGAGISLLSQSVLIVVGPLLASVFLWLMWRPR